jgi:hypothetical protein
MLLRLGRGGLVAAVLVISAGCQCAADNPVAPRAAVATHNEGTSALGSESASSLSTTKVDICHSTGRANHFILITVAESAVAAHLAHGDGRVGGAVPGQPGMMFGPDCRAIPAVPLITFAVAGTLTAFDGPVLAPLAVGDAFSATYTFDADTPSTPVFGGGSDYIGAIQSASFSIGAYHGTLARRAETIIRVLDNHFGFMDQYLAVLGPVHSGSQPGVIDAPPVVGPLGELLPVRFALIHLEDHAVGGSSDALTSSDLPLVPPDFSAFMTAAWIVEFQSQDGSLFGRARGNIQSFSLFNGR